MFRRSRCSIASAPAASPRGLAQAGGALVLPRGEAPGLAMGLGGVGVTLNDLVMLYAGIARLGNTIALTERMDDAGEPPQPRRLMEPVAAWYLGNVMLGTPPPENAAGGRIAFKTGTSYGYRDAWAVGFDGKRTIGVWVGRPDGAPVPGLIARSAAAPILFDAFARTGSLPVALPAAPTRHARGRDRPPAAAVAAVPAKWRGGRGRAIRRSGSCSRPMARGWNSPSAGDGRPEPIALKLSGGVGPLTVLVNGLPVEAPSGRRNTVFFEPEGPGFVRLTVIDATGSTDSVLVRLQ